MNSKFKFTAGLVVASFIGMSSFAHAQSTKDAAPAMSMDSSTAKAHNEIIRILKSGHTYNAVMQLRAEIEKLQDAQVNDLVAIRKNLQTYSMEIAIDLADLVHEGAVLNANEVINSDKLDRLSAQAEENQRMSIENAKMIEQARIQTDLENQLRTGKFTESSYQLDAQGGKLNTIRAIVEAKKGEILAKGWRADEINHYLALGDKYLNSGNTHKALSNYRKVYKHMIGALAHNFAPVSFFVSGFHDEDQPQQ